MNPVVVPLTAELVQLILQIQQIRSTTNAATLNAIWNALGGEVKNDVAAFDAAVAPAVTPAA